MIQSLTCYYVDRAKYENSSGPPLKTNQITINSKPLELLIYVSRNVTTGVTTPLSVEFGNSQKHIIGSTIL